MVLDAGRIVCERFARVADPIADIFLKAEFGKPSELLKNEKGMLRALVDESGDKETLCAMANGATGSS